MWGSLTYFCEMIIDILLTKILVKFSTGSAVSQLLHFVGFLKAFLPVSLSLFIGFCFTLAFVSHWLLFLDSQIKILYNG